MTRAHAIFAPSSAARWLACPASAALAADAPERTSDAADRGTYVHELLEQGVETLAKEGTVSVAHVPEARDPVIKEILAFVEKVGDDRLYALVSRAIADEGGDVAGNLDLILGFVAKLGPGRLEAERKVVVNEVCWGTADILHVTECETVATLGDYKNGGFDVEAFENKQLLTYGVGVLRAIPSIRWFRFAIAQPNSKTHGEVEPIKQWVASAEDVSRHAIAIDSAIARARAGEKPQPGKHCRWCAAFGECEATKSTLALVERAVEMLPGDIPNDMIAQIARVLRGLDDFRKLVDAEINSRLLTGKQVPGAALEPARAFRQWRDEYAVKQKLVEAYGPSVLNPPTPAQAEKLGSVGKEVAAMLSAKPRGVLKASY